MNNSIIEYANEKSILTEIRNANKFIPLEVELSETIIVNDSWGDLNMFKKYKKIQFFATCSYSIDLSTLDDTNITLNTSENKLTITLNKPSVYLIDINEDKTLFEKTTNGFFRFGEIDLSSDEYNLLLKELNTKFENRMNDSDLYDKAINNSEKSIRDLLFSAFGEDFDVNIIFET